MRARRREEIEATVGTFAEHPTNMPKYFRELVRKQFAASAIDFLADTMDGEQKFTTVVITNVKGGGQVSSIVEIEAPGAIRVRAAELLLNVAIPRQAGLVDDEGNSQAGVVLMPPLDEAEATHERRDHGGEQTVIEEEVSAFGTENNEDRDVAPGKLEEVIPPAFVQHILAKRRARSAAGNGDQTHGAPGRRS